MSSVLPVPESIAAAFFNDIQRPALAALPCALPLDSGKVSAGFPSPAADYEDRRLDINTYLIRNPVSTFFFPVEGRSMEGAEIFAGDVLVVDRSIAPQHGHIVVAFINGERLVKRLYQRAGRVALVAENQDYPPIEIREGLDLLVWGVAVGKFKRLPI
jgi:DNA polymerase V